MCHISREGRIFSRAMSDISWKRRRISSDIMSDLTTSTDTLKMTMVGSSSLHPSCEYSIIDDDTYLTEAVLFEIFLRLPLNSIFKFRCVSKLCLSLLSNPFLLTRLFDGLNPSPWTVFYELELQNNLTGSLESSNVKLVSTASPDLYFQFISGHDGFSFKFLTPHKQEEIYLLASTNGLVLCSPTKYRPCRYYVCNPLMRQWVSLPRPQNCTHEWVLNGFIYGSSSSLASTSYKVVRIPEVRDPSTVFGLEIFSSDTGEWSTYKVSCSQEVTILYGYSKTVVTRNGVLYWIEGQGNRIIAYDLNNNYNTGGHQCRLMDLPEERGHNSYCSQCLGESEGFICYGLLQRRQRTLSVWVLEEDYSNDGWFWNLVHKIELKDMFADQKHCWFRDLENWVNYIEPVAFNPVDRNVVILDCYIYILAYNIQTRSSEVARHPSIRAPHSFCNRHNVLPIVLLPRPTIIPPPSWGHT